MLKIEHPKVYKVDQISSSNPVIQHSKAHSAALTTFTFYALSSLNYADNSRLLLTTF